MDGPLLSLKNNDRHRLTLCFDMFIMNYTYRKALSTFGSASGYGENGWVVMNLSYAAIF